MIAELSEKMMRYLLLATATLGLIAAASDSQATPLVGTFAVNIWNTTTAGGTSGSAENQALPTNPLTLGAPSTSGTYTGSLDFIGGAPGTIGQFLSSAFGTLSGFDPAVLALQDSASGFQTATLFEFSAVAGHSLGGTITHDDGTSLFQSGSNVLPTSASAPTSATPTAYSIDAGAFDLWYVEANGLPAELLFDVTRTPEPMSAAILGTGLLGLGMLRRRRS